jgi:hypothetical protein
MWIEWTTGLYEIGLMPCTHFMQTLRDLDIPISIFHAMDDWHLSGISGACSIKKMCDSADSRAALLTGGFRAPYRYERGLIAMAGFK